MRAQITSWVSDEPQTGIIECRFSDAVGDEWSFVGKFYDFSTEELTSASQYPRDGYVVCRVLFRFCDQAGRDVVEIDTDLPTRGRSSEEGEHRFKVFADQLVADVWPEPEQIPLILKSRN